MPNVEMSAHALFVLNEAQILSNPNFIHALGMIVRQSTEPCSPSRPHTSAHFRSARAAAAIAAAPINSVPKYEAWCKEKVNLMHHEHVVPTRVRIAMLRKGPLTQDEIGTSLRTFGIRASIHREEDLILTAMGFKTKMPAGFYDPGHTLYNNPMARYIAAGLYGSLVKREAINWFVQDQE